MKLLNTRMAGFALVALFGGVLIFQILMSLGLHLQGATWGGRFDADPMALRIASIIAGMILLLAILVVLEKLGIVRLIRKRRVINGILWFLAVYLLLNTVANLFSPGDYRALGDDAVGVDVFHLVPDSGACTVC